MSNRTQRITRIGSVAAIVVVIAEVVSLVSFFVSFAVGQPWGTLGALALLVFVAALAPLMLSFYELGGLTPTRLAQLAQALGWASVLTWCVFLLLWAFGVQAEAGAPAAEAFTIGSLGYIGLWIAGANLLAGRWLGAERWLGVLVGLALAAFAVGVPLSGGVETWWMTLGFVGFLSILPAWAFLMARLLGRLSAG